MRSQINYILIFISIVLLTTHAHASVKEKPHHFFVFVPSAADRASHEHMFLLIQGVYFDTMKSGDKMTVYLGENPQEIASLAIPETNKLTSRLKERFYDRQVFHGDLVRALTKTSVDQIDRNLNIPKIAKIVAARAQMESQRKPVLVLLGSPLHYVRNSDQTFFDMSKGHYPNDDTLINEGSPYSTMWASNEQALKGIAVHHIFQTSSGIRHNYHREKLYRFWGLFWQQIGAQLLTFSDDLEAYRRIASHNLPARQFVLKPEGKLIMRFGIPIGPPSTLLEGQASVQDISSNDLVRAKSLELALVWRGTTDLDLRVKHVPTGAEVYFRNPNASLPNGGAMTFWQDRDSEIVQNKYGWEYIKLSGDKLDPNDFQVSFNVFSVGNKPTSHIALEFRAKALEKQITRNINIQGMIGDRGEKTDARAWLTFSLAELLSVSTPVALGH